MKRIVFVIMMLSLVSLAFPAKVGTLNEVLKPESIEVFGNELYVVEGPTVFIYSLKDVSLLRKFGKGGEGPGELKVVPFWSNRIIPFHDFIFVECMDKIMHLSKEGKLLTERRKSPRIAQIVPIKNNFVVKKRVIDDVDKVEYITINLFNSKMEKIKELYRQKFSQQGLSFNLIPDFLNFQVYENKIFVEESPRGFVIEIFDSEGNQLYKISNECKKNKVTSAHKQAAINEFKEDPMIKSQMEQVGGWDNAKKIINIDFPDYIPPIRDIAVSNNKIYTRTYNTADNKEEYVIMDLKGKILKTTYLHSLPKQPLMARWLCVKLYKIENDILYHLQENNDEELELHATVIK